MKAQHYPCFILLVVSLLGLSCARSLLLHRGDEAAAFLQPENALLTPGQYAYDEVRDRISGKLVLAIFNRAEKGEAKTTFLWIRKDVNVGENFLPETWNVVLLDSPEGELGAQPKQKFLNEIWESKLLPVVVTDGSDQIRAVVYKPAPMGMAAFLRPDGIIRLEIGRRAPPSPDIPYSLKLK